MSQDHLGNLPWPSQDLSSFLHETILTFRVGWVPWSICKRERKWFSNQTFSQWLCLRTGRWEYSFRLGYGKIILHRIISVVWLTNFLSEIRSLSNHDDETKFHILSVKPFRRFTSSEHWWSLVSRFFLEQWMRNSLSGITSTGGSTSQLHSVYSH